MCTFKGMQDICLVISYEEIDGGCCLHFTSSDLRMSSLSLYRADLLLQCYDMTHSVAVIVQSSLNPPNFRFSQHKCQDKLNRNCYQEMYL